MNRILSVLVAAVVCLIAVCVSTSMAHAACVSQPGNHRAFVGQPPDLIFTSGVPSTQYIPQIYVNFNDGDDSVAKADCGVSAYSSIAGVYLKATYCFVGGCQVGQSVQVDVARGLPSSGPTTYYVSGGVSYLQGPVPVTYDGTAPAGTVGTIELAVSTDDIGINRVVLATVNVYIVAGSPPPTWFTVTSKAETISGDTVILNNRLINHNAAAKIFAMHYGNGLTWNHPIALTYDAASGRWCIRNEDGTAMPIGLQFVVRIDLSALTITTHEPYTGNALVVDDPAANGNPYAVIVVTPWSSGTQRMGHPFGVAYVAPHWVVYFQDGAPMPMSFRGASGGFFVKIIGAGQYVDDNVPSNDPSGIRNTLLSNGAGTDIVGVYPYRQSGSTKFLRQFCWTTNSYEPIIATFNATALPPPALGHYNAVEGKYYGVSFAINTATVFHEDNTRMADTAPFNVWGPYRADCPPH
jgi:hypothetical protein